MEEKLVNITKRSQNYILESRTSFTKWGNHYKVQKYNLPGGRQFILESSLESWTFVTIVTKQSTKKQKSQYK